jgi:hypothetical protein
MQPGQPSQTMVQAAILRAAHQLLDRPLIFADPIAVGLVPEASEQAILCAAAAFRSRSMTMRRASMVLRSRFAEDRLATSAKRGIRQYVIAATGLDTFPWRQPPFARDMRIFAADLPASLAWTRERFRERGLHQPSNLTFVPVDLEDRQLGQQLLKFGFASNEPMFCSALGIVQFLTPDVRRVGPTGERNRILLQPARRRARRGRADRTPPFHRAGRNFRGALAHPPAYARSDWAAATLGLYRSGPSHARSSSETVRRQPT